MGVLIKDFLSNKLRPVLKSRGYLKKGNSFLRQNGDIIYIINIQGSSLFSWNGKETFYINIRILSLEVEDTVGHVCLIKKASPSTLLFFQVNLRAGEIIRLENSFYTISETEKADQCINDIIMIDDRLCQIRSTEDLYPFLFKSSANKCIWKSTYMRYWAMKGNWDKFDKVFEEEARFCKENETETILMKECKSLCLDYGHKHPDIAERDTRSGLDDEITKC